MLGNKKVLVKGLYVSVKDNFGEGYRNHVHFKLQCCTRQPFIWPILSQNTFLDECTSSVSIIFGIDDNYADEN